MKKCPSQALHDYYITNWIMISLAVIIPRMRRIIFTLASSKESRLQNLHLEASNRPNSLVEIAECISRQEVNMTYIKSKHSNIKSSHKTYEVQLTIEKQTESRMKSLKDLLCEKGVKLSLCDPIPVPWFPTSIEDLNKVITPLNKSHVSSEEDQQVNDSEFTEDVDRSYSIGDRIPEAKHHLKEIDMWQETYQQLRSLHPQIMSHIYTKRITDLQNQLNLVEKIPQLRQLSQYIYSKSGFQLSFISRSVSKRYFLNCFAYKVLCCNHDLRLSGDQDYSEAMLTIVGYLPLLANPEIAEMCQRIGVISLGASNSQIADLDKLLAGTLKFGVLQQNNLMKGYGASIASNIKQMKNLLNKRATFKPLYLYNDVEITRKSEGVQPTYFNFNSLQQMILQFKILSRTIAKPFQVSVDSSGQRANYNRDIQMIYLPS